MGNDKRKGRPRPPRPLKKLVRPLLVDYEVAQYLPTVTMKDKMELTQEIWTDIENQIMELSKGYDKTWKYGQRYIYDSKTGKVSVVAQRCGHRTA